MTPRDRHREVIIHSFEGIGAVDIHLNLRSDFFPHARHGVEESRLDLNQRLAQVVDFLANMRRHVGNQHKTKAHRALDQMRERKMRDDPLVALFQLWEPLQISVDHPDHEIAMGDHRCLRRAGCARRVDKDRYVFRFDRGDALLEQARLCLA